ncbi:hypothetical protein FRC03_007533, partial [Tulasnella sp. 419]
HVNTSRTATMSLDPHLQTSHHDNIRTVDLDFSSIYHSRSTNFVNVTLLSNLEDELPR